MTNTEQEWRTGFIERLEAAMPIDDVVGWLTGQFPAAPEREVMAMLQLVYERDYVIVPAAAVEQRYKVGDNTWDACPQRVALKEG